MPHDVETLRMTLWALAAVGFGCLVYLAWCLDRMQRHQVALEADIEALRLERLRRPTIEPMPAAIAADPRAWVWSDGGDDHEYN